MSWGYVTREETVAESEKQSSTSQSDQSFPGGWTQRVTLRRWARRV